MLRVILMIWHMHTVYRIYRSTVNLMMHNINWTTKNYITASTETDLKTPPPVPKSPRGNVRWPSSPGWRPGGVTSKTKSHLLQCIRIVWILCISAIRISATYVRMHTAVLRQIFFKIWLTRLTKFRISSENNLICIWPVQEWTSRCNVQNRYTWLY